MAALLSATSARADYFDDVAASGRCWSGCSIQVDPAADIYAAPALPTIAQLYGPIADVMRAFAPYSGISAAYTTLPMPRSEAELDRRVTDFFVAVYRDHDYLVQSLDYLRTKVADYEARIADDRAYIAANSGLLATLRPQRDALSAELTQKTIELDRWHDQVARIHDAERGYSAAAEQARSDVVTLVQAIAPPDRLIVDAEKLAAAEPLETHYPPEAPPSFPLMPAGPAPDSASDPWRPVDRPLGLDLTLPTPQKIEMLRGLVPAMAAEVQIFDVALADLKTRRVEENSVDFERADLEREVTTLSAVVAAMPEEIAAKERETREAKDDYLSSRDQMTLRAVQNFLWTHARDTMVVPEIKEFLIANGIDQLAAKLDVAPLAEIVDEARNIKWSSMWYYSGIDEFMAVQERVVGLLNPTFSGILQTAEFNGLASTADGARFAREVFQRLGDDGVELANAAGQVSVDEPYRDLLSKLMGDMGTRRSADEL